MKKFMLVTLVILSGNLAFAKATRLPVKLEKQVTSMIQDLGSDSWEEGDIEIKINAVLFDEDKQEVIVIYESKMDGSDFVRQKPIHIEGVASLKDVVDVARNGYKSLNDNIADAMISEVTFEN
jgi:hypothetical protein